MKLCMSILAQCLERFSPQLFIKDGMHDITGVRFYSDGLPEYVQDYIYIGHASEMFEDQEYQDAVLLANGHDIIIVPHENLETVVNDILMAFDRFNTWEASLWEAATVENGFQRMLDLSTEVFGGLLGISNVDGRMMAYSVVEEPEESDVNWRHVFETQEVPFSMTNATLFHDDGSIAKDFSTRPEIFRIPSGTRFISAYLEMDGEYVATIYIQEKKKVFTSADVRMAEVLCSALTRSIEAKKVLGMRSTASVFADLVEGNEVSSVELEKLSGKQDFEAPWVALSFKSVVMAGNLMSRRQLVNALKGMQTFNMPFIFEENVVSIVSERLLAALLADLTEYVSLAQNAVGISMPFSSWSSLQSRYKQSLFAMDWNKNEVGVYYSHDYAFAYILKQIRRTNQELELGHPALELLKNYDRDNQTELYDTLLAYLDNERNTVATAKQLFIHRNSLMNRVSRIKELLGSQLDDPFERTYLAVSYLLENDPRVTEGS